MGRRLWIGRRDGQRLVILVGLRGGRGHLALVDANKGRVVRTIEVHDPLSARFSPDGRMLAFDRPRSTPNGMARDIIVADLTSGREHRVLEATGHNAPDGLDG